MSVIPFATEIGYILQTYRQIAVTFYGSRIVIQSKVNSTLFKSKIKLITNNLFRMLSPSRLKFMIFV